MFKLTDKNKTNSCFKIILFTQIFQKIRTDSFNNLLEKFDSNKHCKGKDDWFQFMTMIFCQFSKSNSLNDVCNGKQVKFQNYIDCY